VEKSIQLESFSAGEKYSAGQYHPVRWRLHPALANFESDFVVEVSHKNDGTEAWHKIYDGLPTNSSCVWTVPKAIGEGHRLRLRLFHQGDLVGESVSGQPFHIVETPAKQPAREASVTDLSLYYSKRGHALLQNYKRVQADYQQYLEQVTASLQRDSSGKLVVGQEAFLPLETQRQLHGRREQVRELEGKVRQQFDEALREDPRNHHAAYGHAQVRLIGKKEQLGEAVEWLTRTVKIHPGHTDALNDLGAGYIRLGRYSDAARVLKDAIRHVDRADLHYNLGLALFFLNDQPEARTHFFRALSKGSPGVRSGEVYYYLVASMIRAGDKQKASELFASQSNAIPAKLRGALETALNRM
jgi:TolA-binding protein